MLKEKSKNKEKLKRKRGVPPNLGAELRLTKKQFEIKHRHVRTSVLIAGLWCLVVLLTIHRELTDWREWKILEEQGTTEVVPLIGVESKSCGSRTICYYAIYEYGGNKHRQAISADSYLTIQSPYPVLMEIITAGDISRITGTEPNSDFVPVELTLSLVIGIFPLLWRLHVWFRVRHIAKYRQQLTTSRKI